MSDNLPHPRSLPAVLLAACILLAGARPAFTGGEPVREDTVTTNLLLDLAVERLIGRWEAQRSLSGRIRHLDKKARELDPYRSEVMNRRHKALLNIEANGTYTWRAETGEVLRGRWSRTTEAHAPLILHNAERGNDWTIRPTDLGGSGPPTARVEETTGSLFYAARKLDDPTTRTLRVTPPRGR